MFLVCGLPVFSGSVFGQETDVVSSGETSVIDSFVEMSAGVTIQTAQDSCTTEKGPESATPNCPRETAQDETHSVPSREKNNRIINTVSKNGAWQPGTRGD